jgi:hypothetical protein
MSPAGRERPPARNSFDDSNETESHMRMLDRVTGEADMLIEKGRLGTLTARDKQRLPIVTHQLRALLETQLDPGSPIALRDAADGSYDNATTDLRISELLARTRKLDFQHNQLWGTRTIRNASAYVTEDLPNWFGVRWRQVKDVFWQFAKIAGVAGLLTAGGYGAYGYLSGQGFGKGLALFGDHAMKASNWISGGIGGGVSSLWNWMTGRRV